MHVDRTNVVYTFLPRMRKAAWLYVANTVRPAVIRWAGREHVAWPRVLHYFVVLRGALFPLCSADAGYNYWDCVQDASVCILVLRDRVQWNQRALLDSNYLILICPCRKTVERTALLFSRSVHETVGKLVLQNRTLVLVKPQS
jgi:hypothetical protein